MSTEAMKLALEALEETYAMSHRVEGMKNRAMIALREALAQPQQEPVAWANPNDLQNFDMKVRTNGGPLHTVPLYTSPPARKPLTDEQVNLFINGRGDEDDDDYVEPTGDGFGLTDADLVRLVRRVEVAHGIKGDA